MIHSAPERPPVPPSDGDLFKEHSWLLDHFDELLTFDDMLNQQLPEGETIDPERLSRQLSMLEFAPGTTFAVLNLSEEEELKGYEPGGTFTTDDFTVTAYDVANLQDQSPEGHTMIAYTGSSGRDVSVVTQSYVHQVVYDVETSFEVTGRQWDEDLGKWIVTVEEDKKNQPPQATVTP